VTGAPQGDDQLREVLARTTAARAGGIGRQAGTRLRGLGPGTRRVLNTEAALIAEFVDSSKVKMRTLALVFEGRLLAQRRVRRQADAVPAHRRAGVALRLAGRESGVLARDPVLGAGF